MTLRTDRPCGERPLDQAQRPLVVFQLVLGGRAERPHAERLHDPFGLKRHRHERDPLLQVAIAAKILRRRRLPHRRLDPEPELVVVRAEVGNLGHAEGAVDVHAEATGLLRNQLAAQVEALGALRRGDVERGRLNRLDAAGVVVEVSDQAVERLHLAIDGLGGEVVVRRLEMAPARAVAAGNSGDKNSPEAEDCRDLAHRTLLCRCPVPSPRWGEGLGVRGFLSSSPTPGTPHPGPGSSRPRTTADWSPPSARRCARGARSSSGRHRTRRLRA